MWLLNVHTRKLEVFQGDPPQYAILSHRWQEDEVSFDDMISGRASQRMGYLKIDLFCELFSSHININYVWIDTCCIDKRSSTELSEAINSMYRWYGNAVVCCVYLADVSGDDEAAFRKSEWFTRGWTLQELLAPKCIAFYDKNWVCIGNRQSHCTYIAEVTGIPHQALDRPQNKDTFEPGRFSIADRMSWASKRQTTRVEDMAYSLLGIFEVNMPLIYGEGERAFERLQLEILHKWEDLSILAWEGHGLPGFESIARSPSCFVRSGHPGSWKLLGGYLRLMKRDNRSRLQAQGTSTNNLGFTITSTMKPYYLNTWLVPVCYIEKLSRNMPRASDEFICIVISRLRHNGCFRKALLDNKHILTLRWSDLVGAKVRTVTLEKGAMANLSSLASYEFKVRHIAPSLTQTYEISLISRCNPGRGRILRLKAGDAGVVGMLQFKVRNDSTKFLILGHDFDYNVFCLSLNFESDDTNYETSLHFPLLSDRYFRLFDSDDIVDLVELMQDSGISFGPRYRFTLHQMSWTEDREKIFGIDQEFQIKIRPETSHYGNESYYVELKTFEEYTGSWKQYPTQKWFIRALSNPRATETPGSLSQRWKDNQKTSESWRPL